MMKKEKEEKAKVKEAADRETAEVTQAAENARMAEELGGRRPTQRVAGPIFVAGVQCSFMVGQCKARPRFSKVQPIT